MQFLNEGKSSRPELSHEEIELLRSQNQVLKNTLQSFRTKLDGLVIEEEKESLKNSLSTLEGTQEFCRAVQERIESKEFDAILQRNSAIILSNKDNDSEIGMVDLDKVEWWTFVSSETDIGINGDSINTIEEDSLSGPYVFIEHNDVVDAVAEFVAVCVATHPETKELSSPELQKMLSGTFETLRKSTIKNIWHYGMMAYQTYSMANKAIEIYETNPALSQMVYSALYTIAKWLILG